MVPTMRRTTVGMVLAAAAAALTLTACGGGTDDAIENAIEDATGGSVDVNIDSGGMEVDTGDGSYSSGESAEVPDDFPSEVPLIEDGGATLIGAYTDATGWILTYEMEDTSEEVCKTYIDSIEAAGFAEESRFETSGDFTGVFSNDDYQVIAGCGPTAGASIQVMKNDAE